MWYTGIITNISNISKYYDYDNIIICVTCRVSYDSKYI